MIPRCPWCGDDPLYVAYHDEEWGVPVVDDTTLFAFLVLETAQAGLSWRTILHKRAGYAQAFAGFDPQAVARFTHDAIDRLCADPRIVRNRRKIAAAVANARAFVRTQERWGSFAAYLWHFVDFSPITHTYRTMDEVPAHTPLSQRIAADMRGSGYQFVGPTVVYAYLQAVGVVNDHLVHCHRHAQIPKTLPAGWPPPA